MDKKEFFNRMAQSWDERSHTVEMEERLSRLVAFFQLQPGGRVLDVGAGTGGMIPYLLKACGPEGLVWAIDFAGAMIQSARGKFRGNDRVLLSVARVESLPFERGSFDHVICFGAFPHFDDKARALHEMGRILKTGGTLIVAHALSSTEIRQHHENCAAVSHDFLPEETRMKALLTEAGFGLKRLIDRPKCYLCEGMKIPFTPGI